MSAPVFISYSSKDRDIAETICRALEIRGLKCWISSRDVHAGENFQEAIVQALRAARVMLLVFTGNANNSEEVKKEVALAGHHRVTVVPVRVEDVVPSDAFAYEFATRQWIDLFKNWEQEIERLSARIRTILETVTPQEAAPAAAPRVIPPSSFGKRKSYRLPLSAAAILVVLVAGGGAALYLRSASTPTPSPSPLTVAPTAPAPSLATSPPAPPAPVALPAASTPPAAQPQPPGDTAPVPSRVTAAPSVPSPVAAVQPPAAPPRAAATSQASATPFDGTWLTTVDCKAGLGGRAFAYRFFGEVKDSTYKGHQGNEGQPSWFQLLGKIEPDGAANMIANGIVGNSAFAVGHAAKGMLYNYPVKAHFTTNKGTGSRADGKRVCNLEFAKE